MEEKALTLTDRRMGIVALNADYPQSLPLSYKLRVSEYQRRMRKLAIDPHL